MINSKEKDFSGRSKNKNNKGLKNSRISIAAGSGMEGSFLLKIDR
jgi:hypothetical protein